jgi:hypothetical protein
MRPGAEVPVGPVPEPALVNVVVKSPALGVKDV